MNDIGLGLLEKFKGPAFCSPPIPESFDQRVPGQGTEKSRPVGCRVLKSPDPRPFDQFAILSLVQSDHFWRGSRKGHDRLEARPIKEPNRVPQTYGGTARTTGVLNIEDA
jgi:hypothetical protein